jgi:hypothetical protein
METPGLQDEKEKYSSNMEDKLEIKKIHSTRIGWGGAFCFFMVAPTTMPSIITFTIAMRSSITRSRCTTWYNTDKVEWK